MDLDFSEQKLPKVYKKNNKECYLDPIRKRLTYITPEETIRQQIIAHLITVLDVPVEMIKAEEPLSHYAQSLKGRADIVIHKSENDVLVPLAVIECKAPSVFIGNKETQQMVDYANQLLCDYLMVSNGETSFCYHYDEKSNGYEEIETLPSYLDMLQGQKDLIEQAPLPKRIPFDKITAFIQDARNNNEYIDIGENTPMNMAAPIFNLWECFLDTRMKLSPKQYTLFSLVEDLGIRLLNYGNASGGIFSGAYRSFLIELSGENQIISFGVSTYCSHAKPNIVKTTLNIAIDTDKSAHHALQLVIDDNVKITGNEVAFYHSGKIAIGNIGSGKISELKSLVYQVCPKLLQGDKLYLGKFTNDKLCGFGDTDIEDLTENLISYALIRDIYRNEVKKQATAKRGEKNE